ncbi:nucleotidyltransferase family protein [Flavobacteriaceae bacterium]|nr:nucleotidyltransferase family protein [Flavobacteriaceae bacterium]
MNYKETLFFIAKCLTISLEAKNRQEIEKQLQSDNIDWDDVVKVSTAHLVFPALYCNLKRVDFLKYLPNELVSFMEHITNINRKRNKKIIAQARELNTMLLAKNITPIFLKGTGNLLAEIYDDIAERMVGDIDLLFSKNDYSKAIIALRYFRYSRKIPFVSSERHYPRLIKKDSIAAVEIHKELLLKKYTNEFNYSFVEKNSQIIKGASVLSYADKLNLSIISNQINDHCFYYKTVSIRNAYDVFLLSKKTSAKVAVNTLNKLSHPLNCFLASCYEVFNKVDSLEYNSNIKVDSYLSDFNSQFVNPIKLKSQPKHIKIYLFIKLRLYILFKYIIYKDFRDWLFKTVTDKNWYNQKLVQFGIKK